MSNKTEVINRALIKIGANTIASPDEASEQARKALLIFETVAQNELRRQAWSFAKKRATLAPLAVATGGDGFANSFNLPGDCLRLITLNGSWVFTAIREANNGLDPYYAIEGRTLQANDSAAKIVYVSDVSGSVDLWDAAFVEAFARTAPFPVDHVWWRNEGFRRAAILNEAVRRSASTCTSGLSASSRAFSIAT
mgnify:CR=1 FL=1